MFSEKNLIKSITVGLYLILLTPLFFHRSFIYPFIVPKVFVFQALVEIIFALWLGLVIFYPQYRPRLTPITLALLALLVLLIISSWFGIDFHRSFWSTQERGLGLFALWHFAALFLILASILRSHASPGSGTSLALNWRRYFIFSLAVSFVAALFAVIQLVYPPLFLEQVNERPGSFLGNPTFLAAYLLFHIFIGLWLAAESFKASKFKSSILLIVVLFEILVIFLTQTRGALLGLGAGFAVLLLYFSIYGHRFASGGAMSSRLIRRASVVLLSGMIIFSAVFWFTRAAPLWQSVPVLSRVNEAFSGTGLLPRFIALKIGWDSFLARPFLGYGWENFKYPFDQRYDPRLLRSGFSETYFDKPHNVFLEYLVVGGALGFLAYLGLLGAAFYQLFKTRIYADNKLITADKNTAIPFILAALVAYIVQNAFVFDTFGSYLLLFITLAFIDSKTPISADNKLIRADKFNINKYGFPIAAVLLLSALILVYFNATILYANNRQYWGANYFLNRLPVEALDSYVSALTTFHPYRDYVRRDFADVLTQIYSQDIEIPEVDKVAAKAMEGMALAIADHPYDYFLRLSLADFSTTFFVFDQNYLKLGEEQVKKAIELSPNRQQNYYTLAKIKIIQGDKKAALDLMKKAVELDPEVGDPHFYYGLTALEAGDEKLGFKELDRAKELGREYKTGGEARVLANYYADAGNYHEAILYYQRALGINPADWDSRMKLGIVYFFNGQRDSARKEISEVLKALPDFRGSPNFEKVEPIVKALGL